MYKKYGKINPENYEHLWTVGGPDYLYSSIWYTENYQKRNFIICNKNRKHSVYASRQQLRHIAEQGLQLYLQGFDSYIGAANRKLAVTKKFFPVIFNRNLTSFSNRALAIDFAATVEYVREVWGYYFWTEYFCTEKIEEIIVQKNKKYDLVLLKKRIKVMAKTKFEQRKYINQTFLQGNIFDGYRREIAGRLGLNKKLPIYHYRELLKMLQGMPVNIPDRRVFVIGKLFPAKGIFGEGAKRIIRKLEVPVNNNIAELEGKCANKGLYRGRVKVINFDKDIDYPSVINEMENGAVLVALTTGPEIILACKKAGAIVTDQGGITSHAALVSRELGLPCVIGTKIATRVLKDGDLVEVNADNGIVKIIK